MKIYLVDFENVKSKGLTGIDSLDENDTVIIFYSENSDTISFEMHQKVLTSKAKIEYFKVNVGGKNALDFQLSTLLGYLVAKEAFSHIFIISNDRGFDFLHDFWHGKYVDASKAVVFRTRTISAAVNYAGNNNSEETEELTSVQKTETESLTKDLRPDSDETEILSDEKSEEKTSEEEQLEPVEMSAPSVPYDEISESADNAHTDTPKIEETVSEEKENEKTQNSKRRRGYYPSLSKVMAKLEFSDEDTALVSSLLLSSNTKEEFHNLLAKNFKQQATEIYKMLRPRYLKLKELYFSEHPEEQASKPQEENIKDAEESPVYHDVISSKLAQLLANICSADDLEKVAECFNTAPSKQQLYIGMVKAFKKEKGCEIYNAIRGEYTNMLKQRQEN